MPSTETVRHVGLAIVVVLIAGCTATPPRTAPEATGSSPPSHATGGMASASPSSSPSIARPSLGIDLPAPTHPFDAATLLAAMRDSRRPGGVPDQIETGAIAEAVTGAVWTFGSQPWIAMAAGGSCGPQTCTLEVAGASVGAQGDDLWVFEVSPATGSVELLSAELGSLPAEVLAALDALARALDGEGSLTGMVMASADWLPPPNEGRFVLSYRSGGEEGSCGVDLTMDALQASILSAAPVGC